MVECPVCRASNLPESLRCTKCGAAINIEGATIAMETPAAAPDDAATVVSPPPPPHDPDATVLDTGATPGWSVPLKKMAETDTAAPLQPGDVLGERYEILKALGEGGMGTVYKARDRELDRLLALKVIRSELAGRQDVLKRFKQELILARQVTHKNVIRIFDLGMADGRKFITMDFIEGRDLRNLLSERGKLPPSEAVGIIRQICQGLEAAHTEGVVHRDLKPQNIMVDAAGRVWVMDFGLARSMEAAGLTRTGALMGTPDYMSPEQARALKVDARSDLFSLGIIFYEMLTGQLPFQADTMMGTLIKRVNEPAVPPNVVDPSIPQNLSDVIMKCLAVDVEKRYQTTGEILAGLGAASTATASAGMSFSAAQPAAVSLAAIGPGAQFGPRYKIESVIGEGGMGKVYKAHDSDLDRTVALKLVRQELANNPESMQRLKQELLLASRISHRNILRIHDLGDVGGVKFISMAYVQGRDLHDVIAESGRLPVERAVNIARQLLGALEAAHAEGVVHRDLKPRNVLVDEADHVYVSDFGLAKSLESASATAMTRTGEVLGTPRYMSPEQAESKAVDHRADIYSFGVMLYEMVTGDAPFSGESMLQVMYQHVAQKPKNPKDVNPELPDYLAGVILRCLEKDPAQRYQSAAEILRDLEAQTAPPLPVETQEGKPWGLMPWLLAGGAAVLVALTLVIAPVVRSWIAQREAAATAAQQTYLAVLPFKVIGDQDALKYEAEGVADALNAKLFQLKNVHLASQSAVDKLNPKDPLDKNARELGVKRLVAGTIQGTGDKIDLVLSLYDEKGNRLWTREFPGMRQDLLTIQNDVYKGLADALALKPTGEEMARSATRLTSDVAAYELYLKGRNLVRTKRDRKTVDAALGLYDQAIKKDNRFALAYAGMADSYLYLFDATKDSTWVDKSLSAAQQAEQLNDDLPEVHISLGSVYNITGKTTEAIAELKRALELAPNSDEVYRRLANAYMAADQKDQAIQAYNDAIKANPYYWQNFGNLAAAYFRLGDNDKALAAYQRVIQLAPDKALGYGGQGAVYYRQGKWTESIASFQQAIKLQPSFRYYSNIGVAYFYMGKYSDAATMFEKAVELEPNDHLTVCNLADAYRQAGQRDKAMAAYDRAIKLAYDAYLVNPRKADTLGSLALYNAKKGDLKKARDFIARARSINKDDTELMYNEALIEALGGQPAEALQSLKQAFEKGYPPEEAQRDPELAKLRTTPGYADLIKQFARKTN
ncbi:MAG TPA: protein kinase [Bryobacteraceae bacterium]|nr:protein kinase [Bryobacteraceae bacterium]